MVTMDGQGRAEHAPGHVVLRGGRIESVGPAGAALADADRATPVRRVDATGCLVTPGLVNTHHHLYQWVTRGLAVDDGLFDWLTRLYPVWGRIDEDITGAAAAAGLGWLARTGCTHDDGPPLRLPHATVATCSAPRSRPPTGSGCGSCPPGAPWTSVSRRGGLPPDDVVEELDAILADTAAAVDAAPRPRARLDARIGSHPARRSRSPPSCSWSRRALARQLGVRLHTHLAETRTRTPTAASGSRCSPVDYLPRWAGSATTSGSRTASTSTTPSIGALAASGTGVAHCPSSNARLGAGVCRT